MIQITRLPEEVKRFLEPLRPVFSYRNFLVFCWLIVAHLVWFEKATCKALGRYTPKHIGWWHLRRLIACGRWPWEEVLYWLVTQCFSAFPPPDDGVLYLVVDSTLKGKRTKKNSLVKKGRLNEHRALYSAKLPHGECQTILSRIRGKFTCSQSNDKAFLFLGALRQGFLYRSLH